MFIHGHRKLVPSDGAGLPWVFIRMKIKRDSPPRLLNLCWRSASFYALEEGKVITQQGTRSLSCFRPGLPPTGLSTKQSADNRATCASEVTHQYLVEVLVGSLAGVGQGDKEEEEAR
jgi:hypothetical protein